MRRTCLPPHSPGHKPSKPPRRPNTPAPRASPQVDPVTKEVAGVYVTRQKADDDLGSKEPADIQVNRESLRKQQAQGTRPAAVTLVAQCRRRTRHAGKPRQCPQPSAPACVPWHAPAFITSLFAFCSLAQVEGVWYARLS